MDTLRILNNLILFLAVSFGMGYVVYLTAGQLGWQHKIVWGLSWGILQAICTIPIMYYKIKEENRRICGNE